MSNKGQRAKDRKAEGGPDLAGNGFRSPGMGPSGRPPYEFRCGKCNFFLCGYTVRRNLRGLDFWCRKCKKMIRG